MHVMMILRLDVLLYIVESFLELVLTLHRIDGVIAFLSEKLSQDSIENYFGRLRQHGTANENPTIAQVLKSSQNMQVINSIWVDKITGNCQGSKRKSNDLESVSFEDLTKPLPKRCRHRSFNTAFTLAWLARFGLAWFGTA